MVISTGLAGLAAFTPTPTVAGTHVPVPLPVPRVTTAAVHESVPVPPVASVPPVSLDIDVASLRRHVQSIAKLVGHRARARSEARCGGHDR